MTVAREMGLQKIGESYYLTSVPVKELMNAGSESVSINNLPIQGTTDLTEKLSGYKIPFVLNLELDKANDFSIIFSNSTGEKLVIGYEKAANTFFIDRSKAGISDFHEQFAAKHSAPRLVTATGIGLTLVVDAASVELFADGGLTAMTSIFFSRNGFEQISIQSADGNTIVRGSVKILK
jgi:fructan beta-fructosidase